jgi:hypothetical protein
MIVACFNAQQLTAASDVAHEMQVRAIELARYPALLKVFNEKVNDRLGHPFHLGSNDCIDALDFIESGDRA